jgi:pimeloyl-ACP methyl ester carboxylesterase
VSPLAPGAGVELSYQEQGAGDAVVLVHGVAGSAADWEPVISRLAGRARVIAYDRRGYGDSEAPEQYRRTTVQEQAQDAATLVRSLDAEPTLLCGADLGALICLELAVRSSLSLTGLVLVEPATLALVPQGTEALSAQSAELEQAVRERGPPAGVEVWLSAWGDGRGSDPRRVARAHEDAGAFYADYAGLATWPLERRLLRALAVPVHIVEAPASPPHFAAAGRALAALIPEAVVRADGDAASAALEILDTRP